eukprot:5470778-Amphidinium_carterae.1
MSDKVLLVFESTLMFGGDHFPPPFPLGVPCCVLMMRRASSVRSSRERTPSPGTRQTRGGLQKGFIGIVPYT